MRSEMPKMPSPEELVEIEKSRAASNKELIKGGADFELQNDKLIDLTATEEQEEEKKKEMEDSFKRITFNKDELATLEPKLDRYAETDLAYLKYSQELINEILPILKTIEGKTKKGVRVDTNLISICKREELEEWLSSLRIVKKWFEGEEENIRNDKEKYK